MSGQTLRIPQGNGVHSNQPTAPQLPMSAPDMMAIIRTAKSGDQLELVFANNTFNGDLARRLQLVIAMIPPIGNALGMREMDMLTLVAVAEYSDWDSCCVYKATLLSGFDPDYFIGRMIDSELLERVSILAPR
jgi:hypothetical protein